MAAFGISNETRNLTINGRSTIPLSILPQTPVQRKGSLIFDPRTLKLYYSDGIQWLEIIASPGGNLVCIQDTDGDTSVCTDTTPETDSDTIFFTTAGAERARISSAGVFMVGTTTPTPGKIAHFEGDIDVTGVVDPIGVQYTQQGTIPGSTNVPDKGMLYTDSAALGSFSNTLVFVDNTDTPHTLGDMVAPTGAVTDNAVVRFDGTTGKLLKDSSITLDTGVFSRLGGGIGLIPDSGDGFVTVTGNVNISKDLNVFGTTTTSQSQHLLIGDNCIYLNDGYITPASLAGCIVVNYLPTANIASVAAGGFTAGAGSGPTVATDNAFAWSAGDIIQISGASDTANDGLFEVDSYANPLLTIRGVGGNPLSFNFFQNQFETDPTVAGTITQVSVAVISSGPDGIWETNNAGDSTVGMTFTDIGGTLGTSGAGTVDLRFNVPSLDLKQLTAGANILIADVGGNVTISTVGGAASPWQQFGDRIEPITVDTNVIVGGSNANVIGAATRCSITSSVNSTVDSIGIGIPRQCGIYSSDGSLIRTQGNGGESEQCAIVGGSSNTIRTSTASAQQHDCVIIGGSSNVIDGDCESSSITSSLSCNIRGPQFGSGTERCSIESSQNSTIGVLGSSTGVHQQCGIYSSDGSLIRTTGNGGGTRQSAIVGGSSHILRTTVSTPSTNNCVIIGGVSSTINDSTSSIIIGSNAICDHNGCFMFSDNAGGMPLGSGANRRFSVRCSGGARFFSNTLNSTGVSLASGGISWGVISDRNIKEFLVELSYDSILNKVENLPIYSYNLIGNPREVKCMGPMAQDWHGPDGFPLDPIIEEVEDPENEGETITVQKEAKDKLSIETMDMIGVCFASIKALAERNNKLQAQVISLQSQMISLQSQNQLFESRLSNLENS